MAWMTDNADRYRDKQAQKLIDLFTEAHGRGPTSVEQLSDWVASPEGNAVVAPHRDERGKIIP
jgi:hypothetical protein